MTLFPPAVPTPPSPRTPPRDAFTRAERRVLDAYRTPRQVQRWLRTMPYNREQGGETLRTFRGVLQHRRAHCLEAVLTAATILERHGHPAMVLDLESQDKLDHVLLLYRSGGYWGTVARSREWGLHGRRAVFSSIEELVESYYDPYVDGDGRVVGYGIAMLDDLVRTDWRLSTRNVWSVEEALIRMPHRRRPMPMARYHDMLARYVTLKARAPVPTARQWRALYGRQTAMWW